MIYRQRMASSRFQSPAKKTFGALVGSLLLCTTACKNSSDTHGNGGIAAGGSQTGGAGAGGTTGTAGSGGTGSGAAGDSGSISGGSGGGAAGNSAGDSGGQGGVSPDATSDDFFTANFI